jgi:hypothetical protein
LTGDFLPACGQWEQKVTLFHFIYRNLVSVTLCFSLENDVFGGIESAQINNFGVRVTHVLPLVFGVKNGVEIGSDRQEARAA